MWLKEEQQREINGLVGLYIAGDIFDRGMRAATLAQAAMSLFLR